MEFLDMGWIKVREGEVPERFKEAWTRRGWLIGVDHADTFVVINREGEELAKLKSINLERARDFADDKIGAPKPKKDWWWWRTFK